MDKKRIDPSEIIVISYTNKAIGELKERRLFYVAMARTKTGDVFFYGCTNYYNEKKQCTNMIPLEKNTPPKQGR